jgi:GNAT superfamily N-acetyltransferase
VDEAVASFEIRPTALDDWEALRSLRLEALLDTPAAYGAEYADVATWTPEQWYEMAASPLTFVAVANGDLVGMARGGHNDHEPPDSTARWLWGMYVTPRARGSRVAAALVDFVASWARSDGGDELCLFVARDVTRARAFYRKSGFNETGFSVTHDVHVDKVFEEMRRPL